jgi:hypothetical protein
MLYLASVKAINSPLFFQIIPDLYEQIYCEGVDSADDCNDVMTNTVANMFIRFSHLFVVVNSTANFFLYYVTSKRFRIAWSSRFGTLRPIAKAIRKMRRNQFEASSNTFV